MASIDEGEAWSAHSAPGLQRPRVTLAYAQSLDGCIAARPGQPLAISGPESLDFTHELRARHDAILVGIGTVLADDPQLSVRRVPGRNPRPVIVDSQLRCPPLARCLADASRRPVLAAARSAPAERERALTADGAQVVRLPDRDGEIDLGALLAWLETQGARSLMVEGGARIIGSFLRLRLVDEIALTVSPALIGGVHAVPALLARGNEPFPRLARLAWRQLGDDLIVSGIPRWS